MRNVLKSALVRKGSAFALQVPRKIACLRATAEAYQSRPPIVVNSLPKSGTHLLMQIVSALPNTRHYGSFIAQTPSLTLKERNSAEIEMRVSKIAPGEILGAHLYHNIATSEYLKKKNALHLFVHRDPRDVLLSEAHYLAHMNRWHKMHRTFAALPGMEEQVRLAITGNGTNFYPDSRARIGAYLGWTTNKDCLVFRYEDLIDPKKRNLEIDRIIAAFILRGGMVKDSTQMRENLLSTIIPQRSHTYHKGGAFRWRREMSKANQDLCAERFFEMDG